MADSIPALIGQNIRAIRAERGMTLEALGETLSHWLGRPWTRQAVSEAERGKRLFSATELLAFAASLDVTVSRLYATSGEVEMPSGRLIPPIELGALIKPCPEGGDAEMAEATRSLLEWNDRAERGLREMGELLSSCRIALGI